MKNNAELYKRSYIIEYPVEDSNAYRIQRTMQAVFLRPGIAIENNASYMREVMSSNIRWKIQMHIAYKKQGKQYIDVRKR